MYVCLAAPPAHGPGREVDVSIVGAVRPDATVEVAMVDLRPRWRVTALPHIKIKIEINCSLQSYH